MRVTQRKRRFEVRPVYRVTELASMVGMSAWRVRHMLGRQGVVVTWGSRGEAATVTLVAIRQAFPELWESMLLARALVE